MIGPEAKTFIMQDIVLDTNRRMKRNVDVWMFIM